MARVSGSGKGAAWRRRVRRFERAGMTVERFCGEEGVSESSFYRWRKLLAERPGATGDGDCMPAFKAVRVTAGDAAMSIRLLGGARVEVPTGNLDVVRAVMGELLQGDAARDCGGSRC
jgi:transposase-like protein